jgi:hypothetical protein
MDIMMPGIKDQPAAAPWLFHRQQINLPRLICELTAKDANASPQLIEEELQKRGVDAPRELIALWMRDCGNLTSPQD